MARTIYSEIHLHITWHTKNNAPVIIGSIETQLYRWLWGAFCKRPESCCMRSAEPTTTFTWP
jgi:hypothetical protein